MNQLVPEDLLAGSDRILFITHLAIGDFAYLQTFFRAFKEKYPCIKIDLWIDEVRRTRFFWRWKHLKNYVLYDWVRDCGLFNKIYSGTYSWSRYYAQMAAARSEKYPIVISLCDVRSHFYASSARSISPNGFVVAVVKKKYGGKIKNGLLDAMLIFSPESGHVSQAHREWFGKLFGEFESKFEWLPFINIPKEWISYAKLKFTQWGISSNGKRCSKVVFVNSFAKNISRCWPIDRVVKLIIEMKKDESLKGAHFIVNVEPEYYDNIVIFFGNFFLERVHIFTAHKNFFQLPAVISLCDVVVSVETSVIHLASALKLPIIALMRQKNPEWRPFYENSSLLVFCRKRNDWIEDISLGQVVEKTQKICDFLAN